VNGFFSFSISLALRWLYTISLSFSTTEFQ